MHCESGKVVAKVKSGPAKIPTRKIYIPHDYLSLPCLLVVHGGEPWVGAPTVVTSVTPPVVGPVASPIENTTF